MPAYWIARVHVTDPEIYADYAKRATPAIEKHGGKFLARGGDYRTFEGRDWERNVVVEFPSLEAAVSCYNSPDYAEALAFAKHSAERDLCVVEGA